MNAPVPHDIPLPLPAAEAFLKSLLVISFIAHILFVNLMVGGAILTLFYEWKGRTTEVFDDLARFIAQTVTVNKSLAVVLGVAPLLLINVLYTVWFYAANALTGIAWILVIPLVASAFLLTYLHKYTWEKMRHRKSLHMAILALAIAIFLFIPLVFLTNINLMLFPDKWTEVRGFLSALNLPSVFSRYFHFLAASLAVTGLFLVAMFKTKWLESWPKLFEKKSELQRSFYRVSLVVSLCQFIIGPTVLLTLPRVGWSALLFWALGLGVLFAIGAILLMVKELNDKEVGRRLIPIASLLTVTILCMASARHFYRDAALAVHKEAVKAKTAEYQALVEKAKSEALAAEQVLAGDSAAKAKQLAQACMACHSLENRVVGPPWREIQKIYKDNPSGIVAWAKAPGKKRPDYPQMPPMALPDEDLKVIAEYILKL